MPVIRHVRDQAAPDPALVEEIARVLRARSGEPEVAGEPTVVVEQPGTAPIFHYTVVWDKLERVPRAERGRVIMAAIEAALGKAEAERVSIALGLTSAEARMLGIRAA
jgi:hypothetical protein